MNTIQIGILAAIAILLGAAYLYNSELLAAPMRVAIYLCRLILFVAGCFLVAKVAFAVTNLLLNLKMIQKPDDVWFLIRHRTPEWPNLPDYIAYGIFILAITGAFVKYKPTNLIIRGRRMTSKAEAQSRASGKTLKKKAPLFQRIRFNLFLLFKRFRFSGRKQSSYEKAKSAAKQRTSAEDLTILWGMIQLPLAEAAGHFMVVGAPGSGKTITLRLLMQSVLPNVGIGCGIRAVIFDPKRDMLSILAGFLPKEEYKIHVLNPFDQRCVPWDMAADIRSPSAADAVAQIFIPAEPNTANRFFPEAAQQLLAGVLRAFILTCPQLEDDQGKVINPGWTLRDVVLAMRTPARLRAVLNQRPENQHLVETYLNENEERTASNIISTVATKIQPFEVVAAMWERTNSPEKMSLTKWLKNDPRSRNNGESIIVLGCHPARKASLDPLNQAMFHRLSELLLSGPETSPGKTWIFMDELRELGRFEALTSLLNQGRSKGVSVVIGFQSIEGLQQVYGHEGADEIASQCTNKTFLRTDSQATASWASQHFGMVELWRESYSENYDQGGAPSGSSMSTGRAVEYTLLPTELMDIPKTGTRHGLSAVHDVPLVGSYSTHTTWGELEKVLEKERPDKESGEMDRPKEHEYITDWTREDLKRLGLPESLFRPPQPPGQDQKKGNPLFGN